MKKLLIVALIGLTALWCVTGLAVPAIGEELAMKQPDGTEITLRLHGDERGSTYTDSEGDVVVKDAGENWRFVLLSGGDLKLGPAVAKFKPVAAEGDFVSLATLSEKRLTQKLSELQESELADDAAQTRNGQTQKSKAVWWIIAAAAVIIAVLSVVLIKRRGRKNETV